MGNNKKINIKSINSKRRFKKWSFEYWYMFIMIIYMAQMTPDTARMVGNLSGNPIPLLLPIILTGVLLYRNRISWRNKNLKIVLIAITIWSILQIIKQQDVSNGFLSFFLFLYYAIVIAYIHVKVFRHTIFLYYEDIITKIAGIAVLLWIISVYMPESSSFFKTFPETTYGRNVLFLYNWMEHPDQYYHGIMRNAGFSWEPGRFSIMICLGVLCNLRRRGITFKKNSNILILLASLVTTQSTTGYSLCLLLYTTFLIKHISARSILRFTFIIIPIIWGISQLDFMYDKIMEKMQVEEYIGDFVVAEAYNAGHGGTERHVSLDRFVSIYYESINFINDPLLGYSCDFRKSNFGKTFSEDYSLTGGLIQIFGKHGLFLGLFLYGILIYSSINVSRTCKYKRRFAVAICLIISSISYPIFCIPVYTAVWFYGFFIDDTLRIRVPQKLKARKRNA